MSYKIKPLVWKAEDSFFTGKRLLASSVEFTYCIQPICKNNKIDWEKYDASYSPHWDDSGYVMHLAHGVSLKTAKKICNDDHRKNLHKIIEEFVRIL